MGACRRFPSGVGAVNITRDGERCCVFGSHDRSIKREDDTRHVSLFVFGRDSISSERKIATQVVDIAGGEWGDLSSDWSLNHGESRKFGGGHCGCC